MFPCGWNYTQSEYTSMKISTEELYSKLTEIDTHQAPGSLDPHPLPQCFMLPPTDGCAVPCLQGEDGAGIRLRAGQDGYGHHVILYLVRLHQLPQVCVSSPGF